MSANRDVELLCFVDYRKILVPPDTVIHFYKIVASPLELADQGAGLVRTRVWNRIWRHGGPRSVRDAAGRNDPWADKFSRCDLASQTAQHRKSLGRRAHVADPGDAVCDEQLKVR